eukprot:TRINITY_DN23076_c0_g1_i1.p1 TRINITY_DN23076_c0_g1~~TRINITY_DN23076_c0_g1_i1.p1  ORF type:complete len:349 (+),score=29.16 TRINITY_DN23076_c0_g1_i1:86-1048(+)
MIGTGPVCPASGWDTSLQSCGAPARTYSLCADGFRAYSRERSASMMLRQTAPFSGAPCLPLAAGPATTPRPPEARNCNPRPVPAPRTDSLLLASSYGTRVRVRDQHAHGINVADPQGIPPSRPSMPCISPPGQERLSIYIHRECPAQVANLTTPTPESPRPRFLPKPPSSQTDPRLVSARSSCPPLASPDSTKPRSLPASPPILHKQTNQTQCPALPAAPSQPTGPPSWRPAANLRQPAARPLVLGLGLSPGQYTDFSCSCDTSPKEHSITQFLSFMDFDLGTSPAKTTPAAAWQYSPAGLSWTVASPAQWANASMNRAD